MSTSTQSFEEFATAERAISFLESDAGVGREIRELCRRFAATRSSEHDIVEERGKNRFFVKVAFAVAGKIDPRLFFVSICRFDPESPVFWTKDFVGQSFDAELSDIVQGFSQGFEITAA